MLDIKNVCFSLALCLQPLFLYPEGLQRNPTHSWPNPLTMAKLLTGTVALVSGIFATQSHRDLRDSANNLKAKDTELGQLCDDFIKNNHGKAISSPSIIGKYRATEAFAKNRRLERTTSFQNITLKKSTAFDASFTYECCREAFHQDVTRCAGATSIFCLLNWPWWPKRNR